MKTGLFSLWVEPPSVKTQYLVTAWTDVPRRQTLLQSKSSPVLFLAEFYDSGDCRV